MNKHKTISAIIGLLSMNIHVTKEEIKRYFFTLPVKKQVWHEKGPTLCVSGKQKILETFLKNLKKFEPEIQEPIIMVKGLKLEMWFSLKSLSKKKLTRLARFLNLYNKDRVNKLKYELY